MFCSLQDQFFFMEFAFSERLSNLVDSEPDTCYSTNSVQFVDVFYGSGSFTPMLILVFIPVYLCLLNHSSKIVFLGCSKRWAWE